MDFTDKEIREYVNACYPWMPERQRKECIKAGKEARAKYDGTPALQARDRDQYIRTAINFRKVDLVGWTH